MNNVEPYESLREVLNEACEQASVGKGKERHVYGNDEPFENQLICEMGRRLGGSSGPCYQAVKKIYEANRLPPDRAIHELYGAINYLAAAIILLKESEIDPSTIVNTMV